MTAELRRRGMLVNHKRVSRVMREDNLLAVQRKAFVTTTDSNHPLEIYLNLARRMTPTGTNQLWVADITYIRLQSEFVYLALILDAFSRKVVGWRLGRMLAARLVIEALEQAIATRRPPPGLVHHSDRGIQYASAGYVELLKRHEIVSSMSRPANPYDNASCESFIKTLKREEILRTSTLISTICVIISRSSSTGITTRSGCTRRSDIAHPTSSSGKRGSRVRPTPQRRQ